MTTAEYLIAKRATACAGWLWARGIQPRADSREFGDGGPLPDFSDATTLNGLAELARVAWEAHHVTLAKYGASTAAEVHGGKCMYKGGARLGANSIIFMSFDGAAGALVTALERAPRESLAELRAAALEAALESAQ